MRNSEYLPRLLDQTLKKRLKLYGAVCIEGCKWCGKSTTARQLAKSHIDLQDPRNYDNYAAIASTRPDLLLQGDKPRLIDEWQDFPALWDAVRYDVDRSGEKGQYILTGSATPRSDRQPRHSGTGRIPRITMRPMSLFESQESTGEVSLSNLFNKRSKPVQGVSKLKLEQVVFAAARGGWPASVKVKDSSALIYAQDYIKSICENDIQRIDGKERNASRTRALLRSLARHTMSPTSNATILKDIFPENGEDIESRSTLADYLKALEMIHVIEDVPAWQPKLRSKTDIRTSPKRALVDPSLAAAALHASNEDLLKDFNTLGLVFESLCVRDIRAYTETYDGEVLYYRDKSGLECDMIVHLPDAKWGAIEVKIGGNEAIEAAAENLLKFRDAVNTKTMNTPSFLMVLTAAGYAYQREDGVFVVPITTLRP